MSLPVFVLKDRILVSMLPSKWVHVRPTFSDALKIWFQGESATEVVVEAACMLVSDLRRALEPFGVTVELTGLLHEENSQTPVPLLWWRTPWWWRRPIRRARSCCSA